MKLLPRTSINNDDNIGRGMDLALVTLVFLGLGYGLDRVFDTRPVFMISLFVLAMVGQFIKMWFTYDGRMKLLEAERAQGSHARANASTSTTPDATPDATPDTTGQRA